jgi:hypothetical protein
VSEISFDWVWYGRLRDTFLDLSERDRLSLSQCVLSISTDPWPDWVTKEWAEGHDDDGTGGRLLVYQDESWVLVYEVPQPFVIVIYSFDKLG